MINRLKKALVTGFVLTAGLLAGCSTGSKDAKPTVYASFYPVYDITQQIAKDTVNVKSLMPEDKEAHYWEPSARDMKTLHDTPLFIVNGANLEFWLPKVKQAVPQLNVLDLSQGLNLIQGAGSTKKGEFKYLATYAFTPEKYLLDFGHTHEKTLRVAFWKRKNGEDAMTRGKEVMRQEAKIIKQKDTIAVQDGGVYELEMGHEHGEIYLQFSEGGDWQFVADRVSGELLSYVMVDPKDQVIKPKKEEETQAEASTTSTDPHAWISLPHAKIYAERIRDALIQLVPAQKAAYEKNYAEFIQKVDALDAKYREKFKTVSLRHFVVPHEAYAYLSRDYGLTQYPLQGLTSMEEPSLRTIKDAIAFCKEHGITTVFYEYGGGRKGADTIAAEIHGQALPLSTMEFIAPEQKKKNQHYLDLMEMNLENIYKSLTEKRP
ncbi:Zinc ABC transporter, periplasmic-binding protein ZnuA [Clostridiaceae bacterium JG1575]|nr:Zinc ABC transporter, periplasmic-binding protein ZnuA [Clostridiaceae bacterium JG1575]